MSHQEVPQPSRGPGTNQGKNSGSRESDRTDTVVLVQVLRGLAAALVLLGHMQEQLRTAALKAGLDAPVRLAWPGGFGVDLFFCISGFIMVVTSMTLAGRDGAASQFLVRRAIRLVPLYWVATLAYLLVLWLGTRGLPEQPVTALLSSLFFLPYPVDGMHSGMAYPLLSLGWSLNYEVLFYLLFASTLALAPGRAVTAAWVLLALLVMGGAWLRPATPALQFWTQPIVLEFGLGMLLGMAWLGDWRLPVRASLGLALLAVAALLLDPLGLMTQAVGTSTPNDGRRLIGWGLPAAALLFALTGYERGRRDVVRRWPLTPLVRLGDWSYALYLFHPFALIGLTRIWLRLGEDYRPGLPMLAVLLPVTSVLLAAAVHEGLDRPLTRYLNRLWRERLQRRSRSASAQIGIPAGVQSPNRTRDHKTLP